jgi:lysozyme
MNAPIIPDPPLLALITKHEGSVDEPYDDSRGILTVGIGHNLIANPLPGEVYPMSAARMQEVLADDLQNTIVPLEAALPWITDLDEVRQAVLIDMAFNLGVNGLLEFKHTLAAIQAADWPMASTMLLASQPWVSQVGARATEDAAMLLSGNWPPDIG